MRYIHHSNAIYDAMTTDELKRFSLRYSPQEQEFVSKYAKAWGISKNDAIREAIRRMAQKLDICIGVSRFDQENDDY